MIDFNTKEMQELTDRSVDALATATTFAVRTPDEYEASAGTLSEIKDRIKMLDEKRKEWTRPLDETKKKIMDFFKVPLDNYDRAKRAIEGAMVVFQREQERIRQENERKLAEAARREEEKQKKALEAKAKKAEEKGDAAKADELREKAAEVFVPAPIIESQVPKVSGTAVVENWTFRIIDESAVPREYLMVDEQKLRRQAKATKNAVKVPGVEFYAEAGIRSTRR